MVTERYGFNDEESVGDPVEADQAFVLLAHEDTEMVSCSHTDELMKKPLNSIGEHIYDFIFVGGHRWEVGFSSFDGDTIYDSEGGFQVNNDKLFPSECFSTCMYYSDVWQHDDDMVIDLFQTPKDDWL